MPAAEGLIMQWWINVRRLWDLFGICLPLPLTIHFGFGDGEAAVLELVSASLARMQRLGCITLTARRGRPQKLVDLMSFSILAPYTDAPLRPLSGSKLFVSLARLQKEINRQPANTGTHLNLSRRPRTPEDGAPSNGNSAEIIQ